MKIKYTLAFLLLVSPAFIGNAFADPVNTYDSQGRITKTTYDDGSYDSYWYYSANAIYKDTYNAAGKQTGSYSYHSATDLANDTPSYKYEATYDENGNNTSWIRYDSAEAVANNTPNIKGEYTYDENGNQISSTMYETVASVANNAPTSKEEYTYDENGNRISSTYYYSAESVATDAPDYKWASQRTDDGYIRLEYTSSDSIKNNTPDYYTFSEQSYGGVIYDKNGKFSGIRGYYSSDGFNRVVYDENGHITYAEREGYSYGAATFTHNEDGTVTVTRWGSDYTYDSEEEAYAAVFGFAPALNLADSEYAGWITLNSVNNSSPSSSSDDDYSMAKNPIFATTTGKHPYAINSKSLTN